MDCIKLPAVDGGSQGSNLPQNCLERKETQVGFLAPEARADTQTWREWGLEYCGHRGSSRGENGRHFRPRQRKKAIYNAGIELCAACKQQSALGFLERHALAVGAVRNHRVESIDNRDDRGSNWDFFALESAWVSGTVIIFVMMQNHQAGAFHTRDLPKDGPAVLRMLLHEFVFLEG